MLTEKELQVLKRRAQGESQADIAKALKVSQAAVSKFEKNAQRKILEAERLLDISAKLGAQIEEGLSGRFVAYKRGRGR